MGCGCSSASAMAQNTAYDVARTVSETVRATVLPVRATKYATIESTENLNYDVISYDDSETVSIYYDDRSTLATLSSEEEFTCIVPEELRQPEATLMQPSPEPIKRFVANPSTMNRQLYHVPVHSIPPSITVTRADGQTQPYLDIHIAPSTTKTPSTKQEEEVPTITVTESLVQLPEEATQVTQELGEIKRNVKQKMSQFSTTSTREEVLPVISDFVVSICDNSIEHAKVEATSQRRFSVLDLSASMINALLGAMGGYSSTTIIPGCESFTEQPLWLGETERYEMLDSSLRSPRPVQMAC